MSGYIAFDVKMMSDIRRTGFTVIELLTVLAIVALLAGMLFPVYSRSVKQSQLSADIAHLHQIGLAASIYTESHGVPPLSVNDFKETESWKSPIWAGNADPYRKGFRNDLMVSMATGAGVLSSHYERRVVPFKVSYVGLEDVFEGLTKYQTRAMERPQAGWLVSFNEQDYGALVEPRIAFEGAFNRLNFDGSVVHRASQKVGNEMDFIWLFSDASSSEKSKDQVDR